MKKIFTWLLMCVAVISLAACGKSELLEKEAVTEASTELNIYMWENYISKELITNFEAENGCVVHLSYMRDYEDGIRMLREGGGGQDLVMTSTAHMESLIDGGYIEKINRNLLPNSSNINESYWVSKSYCVPYLMHYIYVVYDADRCPIEINSYNDLLDPALEGQIASGDGARNLFSMALVALGYSPNTTEETELQEAYEWLLQFNENVKAYGNVEQELIRGTASVAVIGDREASLAMAENDALRIASLEKDSIQLGVDLYVIPTGAEHIDLAKKFLNYICDPEVMAKNLEEYPYSCPNDAAVMLSSEVYRNNPAMDFDYKKVFFQKDIGEALALCNDYYQELMERHRGGKS